MRAGPAGLTAAVQFPKAGLDVVHFEEGEVAQTFRRFPSGVRLFSTRADLALPGLSFRPDGDSSPTREECITYLKESAAAGLGVQTATTAVSEEAEKRGVFRRPAQRRGNPAHDNAGKRGRGERRVRFPQCPRYWPLLSIVATVTLCGAPC